MVVDSELDNVLSDLFDEYGNCDSLGDPFRGEPTDVQKVIFCYEEDDPMTCYGDVRNEVYRWLTDYIKSTPTVRPFSDAVMIVMANDFASNTKGNYSAIYMWR